MKFKNNKVIFIPKNKDVEICVPRPQPSKKYIPEWFKKMPLDIKKLNTNGVSGTAKKCMPFLDGLTSGYTQELSCDLYIDSTNKEFITYNWGGANSNFVNFRPMSSRQEDSDSAYSMPHFPGYAKQEFHWNTFWEPKTPSGYSTFFFHPANRFDLPFITHNGIIDTDKWSGCGPLPFVIKLGFTGLIPAGTPIYQMLFIKRDSWSSEQAEYDEKYDKKSEYSVRRFLNNGYKKQIWSKKEYN